LLVNLVNQTEQHTSLTSSHIPVNMVATVLLLQNMYHIRYGMDISPWSVL